MKADRYGVAEDVDASRSTALDPIGATEGWLVLVILALAAGLAFSTDTFLTLSNLFDLMNTSAVNVIFASGLLVVLIAGGIDISFAVGASVVQYLTTLTVMHLGGGNWAIGLASPAVWASCSAPSTRR